MAIAVPIAIGIDITFVLLLTELNNSYHLHRRKLWFVFLIDYFHSLFPSYISIYDVSAPSRWPVEGLLIKILQAIRTAPFGIPKNMQQKLRPIISLTKSNYKLSECSCALACQKQRSICFWLPFSLFLSFGQAKERKGNRL